MCYIQKMDTTSKFQFSRIFMLSSGGCFCLFVCFFLLNIFAYFFFISDLGSFALVNATVCTHHRDGGEKWQSLCLSVHINTATHPSETPVQTVSVNEPSLFFSFTTISASMCALCVASQNVIFVYLCLTVFW